MADIIKFLKEAFAALCQLLGIKVDPEFGDNIENAIKDVVDFGKDAAAK